MTAYKWVSSKKYAQYVGTKPKYDRAMSWSLDNVLPQPMSKWEPPILEQFVGFSFVDEVLKPNAPKGIGDAPSTGYGTNLISHKAKEILADIWDEYAKLYPVVLKDTSEPFYMVVPNLYLDCLDKALSEIKTGPKDNNPYQLVSWAVKEQLLENAPLFCVNFGNITTENNYTGCFVTEYFKERVLAEGLVGFCFVEDMKESHI